MKLDKKKIDQFWMRRTKVSDQREATHFKHDATHVYDFRLIKNYINSKSVVLDLGCGTCFVTQKVAKKVKWVKGVDKFEAFLKKCPKMANLDTEAADVVGYQDGNSYDVILMFGLLNYFEDMEILQIYSNAISMLQPGGTVLIKHACGVDDDVLVDAYSEAIGDNYHAIYRSVDHERRLIQKFFSDVKVVDIYPPYLNPWPNTHFYAFVCNV